MTFILRKLSTGLALALTLAGCGQYGDLYLPKELEQERAKELMERSRAEHHESAQEYVENAKPGVAGESTGPLTVEEYLRQQYELMKSQREQQRKLEEEERQDVEEPLGPEPQ
jgi:predicted small lipoprotein YifL